MKRKRDEKYEIVRELDEKIITLHWVRSEMSIKIANCFEYILYSCYILHSVLQTELQPVSVATLSLSISW